MTVESAHQRISEKVFRDPIHNYVHVQHQIILDLINTKEMQRLRRIKQLGTASFTFHGAEHSRFGHSLGVYEITRRICDRFERNFPTKEANDGLWDDNERLVALCASLLHDIGHGPFSHTFEKIFTTDHEDLTIQIITSEETEVNQILRKVHSDFPNMVASVIQKNYPNQQVVQMISSQIDADRMDYLLRDSFYTGTNYGNFDLNRILRVIRPYEHGILFDFAGMHAVEDYVVSRYQMYMQIYFHPVSRAFEVMLNRLLLRAQELFDTNNEFFKSSSPFLVPFFEKNWSLSNYLNLDDGILLTYFNHWIQFSDDPILKDLADRFLNRKPFKSVTYNSETDEDMLNLLIDKIDALGYETKYYTAINSSYDLPYDLYRPEDRNPRTQIELVEKDGTLLELSKASNLVEALTGQVRGDMRVFFPRELYFGKGYDNLSLFQPTLDEIHDLTKTGKLRRP